MARTLRRFFTGRLSPSPFGLGAFPAFRRHSLLPLGGAELVYGTVGAMHSQHVQLHAKGHLLFTNGTDHNHSFCRTESSQRNLNMPA